MRQTATGLRLIARAGFLASGLVFVCLASPVTGSDLVCGVEQLSFTSDSQLGARAVGFSEDGRSALILTHAVAGPLPIPTKPELFKLDLETGHWRQLTNTPADTFVAEIAADSKLERIVFISDRDLVGGNPSLSPQVFLLTSKDERIRQLTDFSAQSTSISSPRISGDGSTVVFLARANPLGLNRDGSREVFLLDLQTEELQQLTRLSQVTVPTEPSLSEDGSRLAFLITHTLSGFSEIDLWNRGSGQIRPVYTAPRLASPVLTDDGKSLFFVTDIDPQGDNLDRSLEIFRLQLTGTDGQTQVADQLSRFPAVSGNSFDNLAVSGNGQRMIFRTKLDLLDWAGEGADNLYLYDSEVGQMVQLTKLRGFSEPPMRVFSDRQGSQILFSSHANLSGQNSDGSVETFLVSCQSLKVFYFPQIGDGRSGNIRFRTSFILANTGADSLVQIDFFSSQGEPLLVDLANFGRRDGLEFNLARGTPLILETQGIRSLQVGYARIRSTGEISASAVFTGSLNSSDTNLYEAAVPMTAPLSEFSVVVNTRSHFQTGLALVNPYSDQLGPSGQPEDPREAVLRLRLYDSDFNLLAERSLLIPPGEHRSQFVSELFSQVPRVGEMVGMLTVQSSRPVAVVTLRLRDDPNRDFPDDIPTLTTLSVAPGIPEGVNGSSTGNPQP